MAAFGTGGSSRGGSPGFRFTLYAILSITLMFLDQRHGWLEHARFVLQAAAYPIEVAVSSPNAAWRWIQESLQTRDELRAENERLKRQQRDLSLRAMRYEALARENGHLRGLRDALPPVAERWLAAEVVNLQLSSLRQRVLLNRGTSNGVFKGQAVLDDNGLIGQTTHVGPWSAEVILITDPEHAVPVQIERTGLRTIAVGAGDTSSLALPYLPANADIKDGDLLVTSGLGGVFPAGYPVARVVAVRRDAVQPLAQVRAAPLGRIDTDNEVVLVWFRADHPAAPAPTVMGDLKAGNPKLQPQPAPPPHPPAPAPAAGPVVTTDSTATAAAQTAQPTANSGPAEASKQGGAAPAAVPSAPARPGSPESGSAASKEAVPGATPANSAAPHKPAASTTPAAGHPPRAP